MVNELIKITYEENKALIDARELYEFLGIKTPFKKWIDRMIEYGFEENVDFTTTDIFVQREIGNLGNKQTDYIITIDMAKEISMIQRNDKGREARKYFIQCEKKLKEVVSKPMIPSDYISALKALVISEEEKALMQPKIEYYNSVLLPSTYIKLITTSEIAKDLGMTAQALNKILNEKKIIYKKGKTWMFYSEYEDRIPEFADYTINEFGQSLKWTEKGREWILDVIKESF